MEIRRFNELFEFNQIIDFHFFEGFLFRVARRFAFSDNILVFIFQDPVSHPRIFFRRSANGTDTFCFMRVVQLPVTDSPAMQYSN